MLGRRGNFEEKKKDENNVLTRGILDSVLCPLLLLLSVHFLVSILAFFVSLFRSLTLDLSFDSVLVVVVNFLGGYFIRFLSF